MTVNGGTALSSWRIVGEASGSSVGRMSPECDSVSCAMLVPLDAPKAELECRIVLV